MADRATHLSKVLIAQLAKLEMGLLDDAGILQKAHVKEVRLDMVAKVLAAEVGLTDKVSISRVERFLPRVIPGEPTPDHEFTKLPRGANDSGSSRPAG